MTIHYIYFSS